MSLQGLPEVPAKAPTSEDLEENLDLPDVPTKAPVPSEVVETRARDASSAGISSASKGYIRQKYLFFTDKCYSLNISRRALG